VPTPAELKKIAGARLQDAEALFDAGRYDGALYMCGYVVEIALKARICRCLKWSDFPSGRGGERLKVHDFEMLLNFSGQDAKIKARYMLEWSYVSNWSPDMRHRPVGSTTAAEVRDMIAFSKTLLRVI
jgi:HEPN domain-containing protein